MDEAQRKNHQLEAELMKLKEMNVNSTKTRQEQIEVKEEQIEQMQRDFESERVQLIEKRGITYSYFIVFVWLTNLG